MTDPYVKQIIENEVAYIEFYHPIHNSLPGNILLELVEVITNAGENDQIKVIVLKSGGDRTFCAGASFKELININDQATGKVFFSGFANVINAMRTCPKFIIGRIQGKTVGGGLGIVAASDYCLATKHAEIKLSELNNSKQKTIGFPGQFRYFLMQFHVSSIQFRLIHAWIDISSFKIVFGHSY